MAADEVWTVLLGGEKCGLYCWWGCIVSWTVLWAVKKCELYCAAQERVLVAAGERKNTKGTNRGAQCTEILTRKCSTFHCDLERRADRKGFFFFPPSESFCLAVTGSERSDKCLLTDAEFTLANIPSRVNLPIPLSEQFFYWGQLRFIVLGIMPTKRATLQRIS